MVDLDAIMTLANRHGLSVVEDGAHQHGGQWRGKGVGTTGDIGTFSFQESEVMTAGEGGGILVQDDRLFCRLDQLRWVQPESRLRSWRATGHQSQDTGIQAAGPGKTARPVGLL